MADLSKFRAAVIEKQEIILNRLTKLTYEEVMQLMASLTALISNLDKILAEEDVLCNRLMVAEMERDPRSTFSRAESIMKASETYLSYKHAMNLKQCAARGLSLAKIHTQYVLNSKVEQESDIDSN